MLLFILACITTAAIAVSTRSLIFIAIRVWTIISTIAIAIAVFRTGLVSAFVSVIVAILIAATVIISGVVTATFTIATALTVIGGISFARVVLVARLILAAIVTVIIAGIALVRGALLPLRTRGLV